MCNNQYVFSQTSHSFQSVINAMVNKMYVHVDINININININIVLIIIAHI